MGPKEEGPALDCCGATAIGVDELAYRKGNRYIVVPEKALRIT